MDVFNTLVQGFIISKQLPKKSLERTVSFNTNYKENSDSFQMPLNNWYLCYILIFLASSVEIIMEFGPNCRQNRNFLKRTNQHPRKHSFIVHVLMERLFFMYIELFPLYYVPNCIMLSRNLLEFTWKLLRGSGPFLMHHLGKLSKQLPAAVSCDLIRTPTNERILNIFP